MNYSLKKRARAKRKEMKMIKEEENSIYSTSEIYDIFFGEPESINGLNFYHDLINEFGQPVLELACGSGRITLELAKQGIDITGIDLSSSMIELAKIKNKNYSDIFHVADMRAFDLKKMFGFVFIPAQSFQHLLTKADYEQCFAAVRNHLSPKGAFLIQIFTPAPQILAKNPEDVSPTSKPFYVDKKTGTKYYAKIKTNYDWATQILYIEYLYHNEQDTVERTFTLAMRQYFPKEIDSIAEYNGFEIISKYGDDKRTPFDKKPGYQNILLKKSDK
jgi:SAM-dependent methyltransferase